MIWRNSFFIVPAAILLALLLPVSGYRHIWQDEAETAERARSILNEGVPTTIDVNGRVSVNGAGLEIEEGRVHRYTPWLQFYAGAVGLKIGQAAGCSQDASLRFPFILSHALSSSLVSYGLVAFVGLPVPAAIASGTLLGLQTVRILNNRSARYHGFLDLFFLLGLCGLGWRRSGRKLLGNVVVTFSVLLLPHFQTLGGSVLASTLVLLVFLQEWIVQKECFQLSLRKGLWPGIFPLIVSLVLILWLSRPWAHSFWINGGDGRFRSLHSAGQISYSFHLYGAAILYFFFKRERRTATFLALALAYIFLAVRILDFHPFSQSRYYLAIPLLLLFWPFVIPIPESCRPREKWLIGLILGTICLPELVGSFPSFQGLRVIVADYRMQSAGKVQPLVEAIEMIKSAGDSGPVLFDYVSQFANWYLPEHDIALLPDRSAKTPLNENNPIWSRSLAEPEWHVMYSEFPIGQWTCSRNCDYTRAGYAADRARYVIHSNVLNKDFEMCVQKRWRTDAWNNAPFRQYQRDSLVPEGKAEQYLILAQRCASAQ